MAQLTDYLPGKPKRLGLAKAVIRELKANWKLFCHLIFPYEYVLQNSAKQFPDMTNLEGLQGDLFRRTCKELYEEAKERISAIQQKTEQLLGLIGIVAPITVALVIYLWRNTKQLTITTKWILGISSLIPAVLLFLATWASLRCLKVTTFEIPFVKMVFDPEPETYLPTSDVREGKEYMECAVYNQVRADQLTDFLRLGQSLFGAAIITLLLASLVFAVQIKRDQAMQASTSTSPTIGQVVEVAGVTGEVLGQVVNQAWEPIVDTSVRINNTVMHTNNAGNFRFTHVYPGVYTIYYDAPRHKGQTQTVEVRPGQITRPPTVVMSQ